ncbi:MAG: hypothetical protein EOR77_30890 [Mesorhizobium sp.]|uniref:hypothetical protein n=1 Tax=Mesorhizobium sp. TaxID=1871066 RepID=UPI000FE6C872|nr:hypothetical protein [Mesorhizobium sp.]RWM27929.1 MAG: hypothetical protein EOR77_30890 [Mesorhizobium sp.]
MYSHQNVTLRGFHWEVSSLTFNLASGITQAHIGRGVSVDASGPNKVKLAADGDTIIGRLASVEDRTVEGSLIGAVELQFANTLPIKAGETVAVGATVVGAGAGEVKAAATPDHSKNFVVEIIGTNAVVVKV